MVAELGAMGGLLVTTSVVERVTYNFCFDQVFFYLCFILLVFAELGAMGGPPSHNSSREGNTQPL